ncbi:MAG: hypothetical protein WBD59_06935, partial [Candidatus Sulfotelmatobacter sp.]
MANVAQLHRLLRFTTDIMSEFATDRECPDSIPPVGREKGSLTVLQPEILYYTPIPDKVEIGMIRVARTLGQNPDIALMILGETIRRSNLPKRTAISLSRFN